MTHPHDAAESGPNDTPDGTPKPESARSCDSLVTVFEITTSQLDDTEKQRISLALEQLIDGDSKLYAAHIGLLVRDAIFTEDGDLLDIEEPS